MFLQSKSQVFGLWIFFLVKFAWKPIYIFDIWKVLIGNIGITTVTLHFTLVYSFKCFVWNNLRKNEFYTLKLWYIRNDATFSESLCNVCMYIRVEINILCFCKKIWSGHFSRRRISHTFFCHRTDPRFRMSSFFAKNTGLGSGSQITSGDTR